MALDSNAESATPYRPEILIAYKLRPFSFSIDHLMAKTYLQVQQQIEELQKEADRLRQKEAAGVLSRIKEAIEAYGFTATDLGFGKASGRAAPVGRATAKRRSKGKANAVSNAPKFRDDQGNVWSGRGPRPAWFKAALEAGKSSDELLAR